MRLAVAAAVAGTLAAGAAAASTPPVPLATQVQIRKAAPAVAFVPTRLPSHYRFRAFSASRSTGTLALRFADPRYAGRSHRLLFSARRFAAPLERCSDGGQKTLQMDGNRVYADVDVVWRCQRTPAGIVVKITVSGDSLPDVALGRVAASAKRLS